MNPYLVDAPTAWNDLAARNRLYYRNREHQRLQHEAVRAHLPENLTGLSLLDFGCGYGDFVPYVPGCDYFGVDANLNVIDEAHRLRPGLPFACSTQIFRADIIVAIATVQCGVAEPEEMVHAFHKNARLLTVFTCTTKFASAAEGLDWCLGPAEAFDSDDDFFTVVMRP